MVRVFQSFRWQAGPIWGELNDGMILKVYADFDIPSHIQNGSIIIDQPVPAPLHVIRIYRVVVDVEYLLELHLYKPAEQGS